MAWTAASRKRGQGFVRGAHHATHGTSSGGATSGSTPGTHSPSGRCDSEDASSSASVSMCVGRLAPSALPPLLTMTPISAHSWPSMKSR
eukprot:350156-Chlamydomonas_euryale.AAC.5